VLEFFAVTADRKILCHCYQVTEAEIRELIRHRAPGTVEEVTQATQAASGCSTCYDDIRRILDETRGAGGTPEDEIRRILEDLR
jgi:NAD(P)H-nitrite reductase large subunit